MASLLIRINIIIMLILHLLVLLLQLSLVLLHLLGATSIISHVIQVHLLLNVDIVLRRRSLLLRLHHHLVSCADWLVWIDSIWVLVLSMLAAHLLSLIIHKQMPWLIMLSVLLITARIWILARSIAQRRDNNILHIIVNRQIYRWLLHLLLFLSAAAGCHGGALLAVALVRHG